MCNIEYIAYSIKCIVYSPEYIRYVKVRIGVEYMVYVYTYMYMCICIYIHTETQFTLSHRQRSLFT